MLNKIILSIVATVMLIGTEDLFAQRRKDDPKAQTKQKQVLQRRQRRKDQAEQPRRQRADRAAVRKRTQNLRDEPQPIRPAENQPMFPQGGVPAEPRQMLGRWLDELTKAYRADDREEMGQLLRKMHQLRQRRQKVRGRGFQDRVMIGGWGLGWQGRGTGRRGQSFRGRGMGGWGRGFQGRGIGRPGPGMPPPLMEKPEPPEDVDRPSPPMPPEDIRKPRPDMPPRSMGGWGRGLQRRGMGRWGRGFPRPWCPWLMFPRPETD